MSMTLEPISWYIVPTFISFLGGLLEASLVAFPGQMVG
jgi:hypothetical protein